MQFISLTNRSARLYFCRITLATVSGCERAHDAIYSAKAGEDYGCIFYITAIIGTYFKPLPILADEVRNFSFNLIRLFVS